MIINDDKENNIAWWQNNIDNNNELTLQMEIKRTNIMKNFTKLKYELPWDNFFSLRHWNTWFEALKYWVGVKQGQSYLRQRRCLCE